MSILRREGQEGKLRQPVRSLHRGSGPFLRSQSPNHCTRVDRYLTFAQPFHAWAENSHLEVVNHQLFNNGSIGNVSILLLYDQPLGN